MPRRVMSLTCAEWGWGRGNTPGKGQRVAGDGRLGKLAIGETKRLQVPTDCRGLARLV